MRKSPAALLSGFTMVEMMVSVAVFSVVIAMAFSTLMA
ncbi:MAG: type II secretion system protein, partial [Candidatus Omnitrophica bacterium]|nr:type II secretion system protein [Candidatus Omnitrophota bacterium]